MTSFDHVTTWVFDLDNTLYPPSARLFDQIEARMTAWIMRELALDQAAANDLRATYWQRHGTTLAGLQAEHGIDGRAFLDDVHSIDMGHLTPEPALTAALAVLPGRRIVFTNGDIRYAGRVLAARGLTHLFDAVYGVEEAGFIPKPAAAAYETVFARDGLTPGTAAMFDDDIRNLAVPRALGMTTVLVGPGQPGGDVHHQTTDLTGFLAHAAQRRAHLSAAAPAR